MNSNLPRSTHIYILKNVKDNKTELFKLAKRYTNKPLKISKNVNGKPYFNNFKKLHFNISHSGVYTAFAFSKYPVGIDLETFKPRNLKTIYRIGTPKEILNFTNSKSKLICFLKIWTQKEAIVKMQGLGIKFGLNKIETSDWKIKTIINRNYALSITSKNKKELFRFIKP